MSVGDNSVSDFSSDNDDNESFSHQHSQSYSEANSKQHPDTDDFFQDEDSKKKAPKKRERLSTLEDTQLAFEVISEVLTKENLIRPVYFMEISSEEEAKEFGKELPLVYIWNEDKTEGTFNISVNSLYVDELIFNRQISPNSYRFKKLREFVMKELVNLSRISVINSCEETGCFPSDLFSDNHFDFELIGDGTSNPLR